MRQVPVSERLRSELPAWFFASPDAFRPAQLVRAYERR
jgi:hypothetical protein